MKALIFTGGSFLPPDNFSSEKYDLVICADKGAENIKKTKIKPDVMIGDFDSVKPCFEGVTTIEYPSEKDETDTEIAIRYATDAGADEIMLLGGSGGRLDHTMANILLLWRCMKKGIDVKMYDGVNLCFVTDKDVEVEKSDSRYISFFALGEGVEGLTLEGVKYPLAGYDLESFSSLCVSNEIISDKALVSFSKGDLLVILSNDTKQKSGI